MKLSLPLVLNVVFFLTFVSYASARGIAIPEFNSLSATTQQRVISLLDYFSTHHISLQSPTSTATLVITHADSLTPLDYSEPDLRIKVVASSIFVNDTDITGKLGNQITYNTNTTYGNDSPIITGNENEIVKNVATRTQNNNFINTIRDWSGWGMGLLAFLGLGFGGNFLYRKKKKRNDF